MQINTDCFILGTKTHPICEDYAITVNDEKNSMIIISDGCSTSKNTDIGARLLTHCIKTRFLLDLNDGFSPDYQVAKHAMSKAAYLLEELNVDYYYQQYEPLNATIIVAFKHKDKIYVQFYGDGYCVMEKLDGQMDIYSIKVANNAPYYLVYERTPELIASYLNSFGIGKVTATCTVTSKAQPDQLLPIISTYTIWDKINNSFDLSEYRNISILSDGIEQIRNVQQQSTYDIFTAIHELHDWKSYAGLFVQRRCKKFFEKLNKEGYYNLDDFSMATMHIEHEG